MNTYKISGRVTDRNLGFGIPDLRVEIWDKDVFTKDDKIWSTETDEYGVFKVNFDENSYRGIFFDRKPDLYFKVFRKDSLIENTKGHVMWNVNYKDIPLKLETEATTDEIEQYHYKTGNIDKPENVITTALRKMTGQIRAINEKDREKLSNLQEKIASALIYQDPQSVYDQKFLFEESDLYAPASISEEQMAKINEIVDDAVSRKRPPEHLVFMRTSPVRAFQIPGFAAPESNGVKVTTEGPFMDNFGRDIFFDLVTIQQLVPLYINGWTYPAIFFKGEYEQRTIGTKPLLQPMFELKREYEILPNSFWINAKILDPSAPEGFFCGLRVRGGKVRTSHVPHDNGGKLTVSETTDVQCELQLDTIITAHVDPSNPFGKDARQSRVRLPEDFNFSFKGNSKHITNISHSSWNVFGYESKFKYDGAQNCSYLNFINHLIIPLSCSNKDLECQSLSPLCNINGKSQVKDSWWAIPAAKIDLNLLPEAEGNGSLIVHGDPGLSVQQSNMENKLITLIEPYIIANPGMISLIDMVSIGTGARQQFNIWRDNMNPHGTTMEWMFYKDAPYYFISTPEFEIVAGLTNVKMNIDRPVKVDSTSVAFDTKKSLFAIAAGSKLREIVVIDNDILWDHTLPGDKIPKVKPFALALQNALFTVSPPNGMILFGKLSEDLKSVDSGKLFLTFGLFSYLPTLPDPYAANLGSLTRQFLHQNTRGKTGQMKQISFWLISLVSWKGIYPRGVDLETFGDKINAELNRPERVNVSFHLAPLASPIIVETQKKDENTGQPDSEEGNSQYVFASWKKEAVKAYTGVNEKVNLTMSTGYQAYVTSLFMFPDIFTLLDVSSNANQMGISMAYLDPIRTKIIKDRKKWHLLLAKAGQEPFPFKIKGLEVQTFGFFSHAYTVPQIAWEPVLNLTKPECLPGAHIPNSDDLNPDRPEVASEPFDPPFGFNYYFNDGIPTRVGNFSPNHVTLAPIPLAKFLVDMYKSNEDGKTYAYFNLPFGMIALAQLDSAKTGEERPEISDARPLFSNELTGGLQISLTAGKSINLGEDQLFEGYTFQLHNINKPGGTSAHASTLAHSPDRIFNGEFNPVADLPEGRPAVPLEHIGLSGYGASTFSDWLNKEAKFAQTSQALFNVITGRTSHEVVQVKSMIYPWGISVVRTITLFRLGSGYVARIDSGWQSQSDGKFDFSYRIQATNPSNKRVPVRINNPFVFHPGIIQGLYKVRNIHEIPKSFKTNTTGCYGPWNIDGSGNLSATEPGFNKTAELQAVKFDCDVQLENVVEGGSANRVVSRGVIGYIQLSPPAVPIDTNAFKALIEFENGSLGGEIDCVIKIAGTNQRMRINRFDVNNSTDTDTISPMFVCAARGSVILPKEGSWTMVQHNRGTGEVSPLPDKIGIPLIRAGKLLESDNGLYTGGWDKLVDQAGLDSLIRLAHPADLIKAPDNSTINFGLLQNMNTQKVLVLTPSFSPGINTLLSKTPPLLADAFKLMKGNAIFPSVGDAESDFGDAVSLVSGIDKYGTKIAKVFENAAGLLDGTEEVMKLLDIKSIPDITGKVLDQGFDLLKKGIGNELDKLVKFDLPDLNFSLVDITGLKIYIEYKADHKDKDGNPEKSFDGKFDYDVDSFKDIATDAAKTWKGRLNNLAIVVDLGPLKRLVTVKGNFNSEQGSETDFGSKDPSESQDLNLPVPEVEFSKDIKTVMEILELLAELSAGMNGNYADLVKKGMKIAMSNAANLWEYKFEATKEIPLIKFPQPDNPQAPLKLEASLSLGFNFNAALKITTDPKQLLPTAGAYLKFHGGLSVMCASLGVATIYAHGETDLALRADTSPVLSLQMKFGFGAQIAAGLPVVGTASLLFMVGVEIYVDTNQKVVVTAMMLFRGEAELLGGIVSVTITIEAKGSIEKTGADAPTNCKAQVTFAIDISIFWVIDIEFSESWEETRQIA